MGSAEIGVAQTGVRLADVEAEDAIGKALGISSDVRSGLSAGGEYAGARATVVGAESAKVDEGAISAVRMDLKARPVTEGCVEGYSCGARAAVGVGSVLHRAASRPADTLEGWGR